jgi:hypothetical protein
MALRDSIVKLVDEATAGFRSAPGPATRYRDATASLCSAPSTPTKERYEPFQTFRLSSPSPQDGEPFGTKLSVGKNSKKGEKTRARRALKVKIPDGKKTTVPLGMATPSRKIDVSSTYPDLHCWVLTTNNSLATLPVTWPPASQPS